MEGFLEEGPEALQWVLIPTPTGRGGGGGNWGISSKACPSCRKLVPSLLQEDGQPADSPGFSCWGHLPWSYQNCFRAPRAVKDTFTNNPVGECQARGRKTFLLSFRGAPAWMGVCTEAGGACLYTEPASSCFCSRCPV